MKTTANSSKKLVGNVLHNYIESSIRNAKLRQAQMIQRQAELVQ